MHVDRSSSAFLHPVVVAIALTLLCTAASPVIAQVLSANVAAGLGVGDTVVRPTPAGGNPATVIFRAAPAGSSTLQVDATYSSGTRVLSTGQSFPSVGSESFVDANLGLGRFGLYAFGQAEPRPVDPAIAASNATATARADVFYRDSFILRPAPGAGVGPLSLNLHFDISGTFTILPDVSSQARFEFGVTGSSVRVICSGILVGTCQLTTLGTPPSQLAFSFNPSSGATRLSFDIPFVAAVAGLPVPFSVSMDASANQATADFSRTALVSVVPAPGVEWTTQSGLLLAAVPEPSMLLLWLSGMVAIGVSAWRRRTVAK